MNFVFRKGNYYFRGSDIGFYMIRDSYEYMLHTDFQGKYNLLIQNLDEESIKTVNLFMKHIRLFYHNNIVHESEIFTEREKRLQQKSFDFMGKYGVLHPTGYGLLEDSDILSQIGDGVVFDIGASDGIESLMFANLLPKKNQVYAFEPSSYNFSKLSDNIQKAGCENKIFPQNIALADTEGEMEIFGNGGAEVSLINLSGQDIASEKVKVTTVDAFANQKTIQRVGLIKWDIEGAEIESLIGAREIITRDKPVLVISIYHNGREFFETKPIIESWNLGYRFRIFHSEPGGTWVGVVLICY